MACSGCEKRREAIKLAAKGISHAFQRMTAALARPPVVSLNSEDAGRKAINKRRTGAKRF